MLVLIRDEQIVMALEEDRRENGIYMIVYYKIQSRVKIKNGQRIQGSNILTNSYFSVTLY